jgi:ornithine cyclodeaminase/alanine dehydrogenase-like protein (mu-crystallin family)
MSGAARYLTETDVAALVDLNDAIDALEAGLRLEGEGDALDIPKALGTFGQAGSLHALGAAFPDDGMGAFKTWVNVPTGAAAVMTVFDLREGRVAAFIEAGLLGQLRTAGISGLATRALAAPDADDFALIGTGRQAMMQLAAVSVVRPLRRVRVFSPTPEKRQAFIGQARDLFPFALEEANSCEAALAGASIATIVTRATAPFISGDMLAEGAHVNAVGAILPGNAELKADVFDRASALVVDSVAAVQQNSREFIDHFGARNAWDDLTPLSRVLAQGLSVRSSGGVTLFKAMGMGVSDLSVARLVLARAAERDLGLRLPPPSRARPRWRAAATA